ncbi:MAG TPA: SGNH/GDSL hydrolase family protein [Anaerolineae bacterium]|nr:SGNH/GDSL hydrolase family protein [Anaerolineae bacterium]HQI84846.1 SGNH/GDSL hydrolase family protein [Anaerolineae bacterium]
MTPLIEDNAVVLFQGDSITDAGRSRADDADLGRGYAAMAAAWFSALYPQKRVTFLNRGISGDRVKDLRARWQQDCLNLKPTWVSIMIGVNDTWRRYDSHDPTPVEAYERDYRAILEAVRDGLNARLILLEPFLLPTPPDREAWRVDLDPKIAAARKLAREFNALYVPLDGLFAEAAARREPAFWLPDGVHPTPAGHAFIAQAWLRAVRAL